MDGNKDEALKCLRIGKEALDSGDRSRAIKFLTKARRLDPSLPIDDLLSTAEESNPNTSQYSSVPTETMDSASSSSSPSTTRVRASKSSSRDYTEEQLTIVQQIKTQKDYYQILGVEKTCSVEDVRKAYRKLSLKVHPDKNKAPGAEEAFKAVSKAFQCLSDEENRKRYDIVGSEEPSYGRAPARRHSHQGFNGFYNDEFDPDEIFRNFFGGGPRAATPFGTFHFRTGGMGMPNGNGNGNGVQHGSGGFNLRTVIQILPVLFLLLLNFLPSSDPVYVLSRSEGYNHKLETARGVAYFVKSAGFEQEYPYGSDERTALERRVEREYVGVLSQNCRVELQRRQWGLAYKMPHCDMLEKFQGTA
ncbi:chaperone protein dnaJ 49-like [Iris pallida]|uniref:Chaperone protein dnaJ 49-like n=1 Tax=Iris pallida TaxID=29817 RepID=A0AAX6I4A1_IRIPA|nr:chaperone protein dnaJ 49-like [Iris pallida]